MVFPAQTIWRATAARFPAAAVPAIVWVPNALVNM